MNGVRKAKRKGMTPKKQSSIYAPEPQRIQYIEAYLHALIGDAKCIFQGRYSNADATRDCRCISQRLRAEGSGFATLLLPTLSQGLFQLKENGVASFPQFKLTRGMEYPALLGPIFSLALNSNDLDYRVRATDFIYSFSSSFKKLRGDYPVNVVRKLFADFCKTDVDLGNIDFHSRELRLILEDVRAQWRDFVAVSGLVDLMGNTTPQPGPGATNSPTKKNMRYRPHALYKQIDEVLPYSEWFYPTLYDVFLSDGCFDGTFQVSIQSPTARYKAIPKTAGKPRGICIEENEMQALQQAMRKAMYIAISRYFGDNIALRNQSVNAQLALRSSSTLEHATIDESEASDRISRRLVTAVMYDTPEVLKVLMALSTRYVVPPDEVKDEYGPRVATDKYAPMGSALCFPVMSVVHMLLVRAIIRLSTPEDTRLACNNVYVYGDDIILPTKYVAQVYKWLPKFGMKINENKSFYKCHFRESCGVHAYHGKDITPVYVKYIPYHNCADAKASVFAVERQLFDKGFLQTAEVQRSWIRQAYGDYPYVPEGLSLAGYTRPFTDDLLQDLKQRCRRKKRGRFQSDTFVVSGFKKRVDQLKLPSDLDAYTRWMWTSVDDARTVGDSRDDLVEVTRSVLESALGPAAYGHDVSELVLKRFPIAGARYTHPSWYGRLQKNFAALSTRCYL